MDWIEVTLLDRRLVVEEEAERTRRMGHPDDEALRRGEAAWERLSAESGGGPVLEVWMETTCDRCLDLRNWTATLSAPGAARPLPPRWVQSEVMRRTQEVRQVLDASRRLTRSWVRAHLAFDLTSSGRAPLEDFVLDLRRPERWAEPVTLRRRAGGPGWGERLCAAWDAVAAGAP